MTTQHTPGPWLAAFGRSSIVGRPIVAPHAMGRSICNVSAHDEEEANAYLIAAAPDLLAALEQAEEAMTHSLHSRGYVFGTCTDEWSAEVRLLVEKLVAVRAVIAKARGEGAR